MDPARLLTHAEVELLVSTGVAWAAAVAREGDVELACRLRDEFLGHWQIDADAWNAEIAKQEDYADRKGNGAPYSYEQVRVG